MASDRLYDLAFQYKKTKLWEKVWESQIFAVKLSDGRTGYIAIMAPDGQRHAMNLYIGEEGFRTLAAVWKAGRFMIYDLDYQEYIMGQNCLQCTFEKKDGLHEEEYEKVRAYARSHGIRMSGKYAYPRFLKLMPYCIPWHLQTEEEEDCLCQGLTAAIEMAGLLDGAGQEGFGLEAINGETEEIPMLEPKDGGFVLGKARLPEDEPRKWPEPKQYNDITMANLKKVKKQGVWQCEVMRLPEPVQDSPEEIPAFPVFLLAAEAGTGCILPIMPMIRYEEKPEELLNQMADAFVRQGVCPQKLEVQDERTYALVKVFCEKLGVDISIEEILPELDDAKLDFMESLYMSEHDQMDEFMRMLGMVAEISGGELPEEFTGQIDMLKRQGLLPDILSEVLAGERPGATVGKASKKKAVNESYVISVSLGTGCYRHIRISGKNTLWQLHCAIIDAFEFDDDHAHGFFMDNKKWSDRDSYYAKGMEDGGRTTEKCRLGSLGLYKGMPFKYVFDFGAEWTFQCKVLRVEQGDSGEAEIIKSKGEAPAQYGDWDDEWDEE